MVRFAAVCRGSGGVEVAQAGVSQSVDLVKPEQHALDNELRFAISVGRLQRIVFHDGNAPRLSVHSRGGRQHETRNAVLQDRLQQVESARGVVVEILLRAEHRLSRFDVCREVHHGVESALLEGAVDGRLVASVSQDELSLRRDDFPVALAEIVQHGDGMSGPQQAVSYHASNVSRATSDQNPHSHRLLKAGCEADCNAWTDDRERVSKVWTFLFGFWTNCRSACDYEMLQYPYS